MGTGHEAEKEKINNKNGERKDHWSINVGCVSFVLGYQPLLQHHHRRLQPR